MQQELIDILKLALSYSKDIDQILRKLSITKRQFHYRLNKINDILALNDLKPLFVENNNLVIEEETQNYLIQITTDTEISYEYNEDERVLIMFLMLFVQKEFIDTNTFIYYLKTSRSTVNGSIKKLKSFLEKNSIELSYSRESGYCLVGDELEIRKLLTSTLMNAILIQRNTLCIDKLIEEYHLHAIDYLRLVVEELMDKFKVVFVGSKIDELAYLITFLLPRLRKHSLQESHSFNRVVVEIHPSSKEMLLVKELYQILQLETVAQQEFSYLYVWIVSSSVGDYHADYFIDSEIVNLIKEVMNHFKALTASDFQDYDDAFIQLYSHFKPAYFRLMYNLPIYNPLTSKIKNEYGELYHLVERSLEPLNTKIGHFVPEDEVAFLTMHFATFFDSSRVRNESFKAAVICTNGIASSLLLYNELTHLLSEIDFDFPMDYVNFKKNRKEYDIVFTTYSVKDLYDFDFPVVFVHAVMNEYEKKELLLLVQNILGQKAVKQIEKVDDIVQAISKYVPLNHLFEQKLRTEITEILLRKEFVDERQIHLADLIEKDQIIYLEQVTDWSTLINQLGDVLLAKSYIGEKYTKKINYLALYDSFVVAPLIAIPHTDLKEEVFKSSMVFGILPEEIVLKGSSKKVKYVFLLAANDNKSHLCAMNELLQLLSDPEFYRTVKNKNIDTLYDMFKKLKA